MFWDRMDKIQTLTNSIYEYAGDEIPPRPYYGTFSPWWEIVIMVMMVAMMAMTEDHSNKYDHMIVMMRTEVMI